MSGLDTAWAELKLEEFLHESDWELDRDRPFDEVAPPMRMVGSDAVATEMSYVVERILDRVTPGWPTRPENPATDFDSKWNHLRTMCRRGLAALRMDAEIRERLGDGAPQMDAGKLHPWIWDSARALWQSQHFNQAVQQAAISVNAFAQQKVGRRDISETDLFKQVFSPDQAKPERPRLRLMDDDGSDTFRSVHRGVMALAEGLFAAIRNPIAHTIMDEMDEQEALEQLAAFSILARWVDKAKVVKASEGEPVEVA